MSASGPGSFCSKPENQFSTATVYKAGDIVCFTKDNNTSKYIRLQSRGDAGHAPEDPAYPGLWSKYRDTYKEDKKYKCGQTVKKGKTIFISNANSPSSGMDSFIKFIDLNDSTMYPIFNTLRCGPFEPTPVHIEINQSAFSQDTASGPASGSANGSASGSASGSVSGAENISASGAASGSASGAENVSASGAASTMETVLKNLGGNAPAGENTQETASGSDFTIPSMGGYRRKTRGRKTRGRKGKKARRTRR